VAVKYETSHTAPARLQEDWYTVSLRGFHRSRRDSGTLSGSLKAEFDAGSVTLVKQTATLVVRTFTS